MKVRSMPAKTVKVATLGFPRIGARRELKFALESYWSGAIDQRALGDTAARLRAAAWARQRSLGVDIIPSNDFSFYDHVLDTSAMVGAIPSRFGWQGGQVDFDTYFAMARGRDDEAECGRTVAQEMTKWFDTNYHYMVPEFVRGQRFALSTTKLFDEFEEALALGYRTRPVILGPVTYLSLGKSEDLDPLTLLADLIPVYEDVLQRLGRLGAEWVQIDEPCLVLDLTDAQRSALERTYTRLATKGPKLLLTTYFGSLDDNLEFAASLPVQGLHVDLVRGPDLLEPLVTRTRGTQLLSLGVVDGRNVWRTDLNPLLDTLEPVAARRRIVLAPSCSLLHVPLDLEAETCLDADVRRWLAFAVQKVGELNILAKALNQGRGAVADALQESGLAAASRRVSSKIHDPKVADKMASYDESMGRRRLPYAERRKVQHARLGLPILPTTTIGSFPQTLEVRQARAAHLRRELDSDAYEAFLRAETERTIRWQEAVGLDVLVHGEFERNDMVQYFGESLAGFAFTRSGWVQSYGSRCVRPPILFGDVSRPQAMTVGWWKFAQTLTKKPVKAMLTGPVTILNWSFVRDDQPRSESCRQIALAIRDEVLDLEAAGAPIIQIDEAALREGLPLRRSEWSDYLGWAVESFRLAANGVADETQIHTHMCYSEFNDIIRAIAEMDADVISIETARSRMELLSAFTDYQYPNEIGPGVYDIHAPRLPTESEMTELLALAIQRIPAEQLWVNPDCGLKTRKWKEVEPALAAMVAAAKKVRASLVTESIDQ